MNFNIVDGNDDCMDLVDKFVEYYNNRSFNVKGICDVLGITRGEYRKLRRHCKDEGLIILRNEGHTRKKRTHRTHPKYYHFANNMWIVLKTIKSKRMYFGSYESEDVAKRIVEELKRVNWDKGQLEDIKRRVLDG